MAIKRVVKETAQGGVVCPLLWILVINRMLKMFGGKASKLIAYADDVVIIVSSIMNSTFQDISEWARSTGLDINVEKTDMVLFTRRYKILRWYPPKIDSRVLTLESHAKYLGVILDSKLLWKQNVKERVKTATNAI